MWRVFLKCCTEMCFLSIKTAYVIFCGRMQRSVMCRLLDTNRENDAESILGSWQTCQVAEGSSMWHDRSSNQAASDKCLVTAQSWKCAEETDTQRNKKKSCLFLYFSPTHLNTHITPAETCETYSLSIDLAAWCFSFQQHIVQYENTRIMRL